MSVVDMINQIGLMDIVEVRQIPTGEFDIIGRVNDKQADTWGTVMRKVLLKSSQTKNEYAIDFSRVYRLARRDILADAGVTVRNRTTKQVLKVPELVLVWHWRIRFDESGAYMLAEELQRLIDLAKQRRELGKDEVPVNPAVLSQPSDMPAEFVRTQAASVRNTTASEAAAQGYEVIGAK